MKESEQHCRKNVMGETKGLSNDAGPLRTSDLFWVSLFLETITDIVWSDYRSNPSRRSALETTCSCHHQGAAAVLWCFLAGFSHNALLQSMRKLK